MKRTPKQLAALKLINESAHSINEALRGCDKKIAASRKRLKVFTSSIPTSSVELPRFCDCVMATTNQLKFKDAAKCSRSMMHITGNAEQIKIALAEPEIMFINKNGGNWPKVWVRLSDYQ